MQQTPNHFVTGTYSPAHQGALYLPDEEYGRALDCLVKGCADALLFHGGCILLGKRKVEPHPDWWFIGGRMRPGETPAEAVARNVKRELGLDIDSNRFTTLNHYSFVWGTRAQPPVENGTADISAVHLAEITGEEAQSMHADEKEYETLQWFDPRDIAEESSRFHPALKQAVKDFEALQMLRALRQAVEQGKADQEIALVARNFVNALSRKT